MSNIVRVLVLIVVVPATWFFVFWVPGSLLPFSDQMWPQFILALVCTVVVARFVWTRVGTVSSGALTSTLFGALIVGGISFSAGFFGPMIFDPDANQGPLLGLFITGPLGAIAGAVGGFIYWQIKKRSSGPGVKM
ncbi:MAG TPA: hypothetical protein VMM58_05410 [Bacteroidota bacterium]|nr:hypothetical protein [Bacteroidota bacterium]